MTWDEFLAIAEVTAHDLRPAAVGVATYEVEQCEEAVAAEVEQLEEAVAEAKNKVLAWVKGIFESFARDEDGAVSKRELEAKLKEEDELDGESISTLVGRSGFNPLWRALSALDTNKDGSISWEELYAHILGPAREDEKVESVNAVTQGC